MRLINRKVLLCLGVASNSVSSTFSFIAPRVTTKTETTKSIQSFQRRSKYSKYKYGDSYNMIREELDNNENNDDKSEGVSMFDFDDSITNSVLKTTELWLDLRGSSILPHVAIDYMLDALKKESNEDNEENSITISKVVLSIIDYEKFQTQINNNNNKVTANNNTNVDIIIVNDNSEELFEINDNKQLEFIGKSYSINGKIVDDIMSAMGIFNNGNWILLDTNDMNRQEQQEVGSKRDAICNFMQLITSSTNSPLLLDWNLDIDDAISDNKVGGIAIGCNTNSDLLNIGGILQSLGDNKYESLDMSENGDILYLPSSSLNDDDNTKDDESSTNIKSAIILPMDVSLWKSSLLLFR